MSEKYRPKIIVITGPTASGKSAFLYQQLAGLPLEIIIADSGQIYKELSVGVAAPSKFEQKVFRHHLLQHVSIIERYSAGRFFREALEAIKQIHAVGKIPVIVGGTFFYIKSLWDGISKLPEIEEHISARVNQLDPAQVRKELALVDKISYDRLSPNDTQRNRRALLVSLSSQKPFSEFKPEGGKFAEYEFLSYCFYPPRQKMYDDINHRTELIFAGGIIQETANLLRQGFSPASPGFKTIGYREVVREIQKCQSLEEPVSIDVARICAEVAQATRHFAKRQMTWFNAEPRLKRIDPARESSLVSREVERFCTHRQLTGVPE